MITKKYNQSFSGKNVRSAMGNYFNAYPPSAPLSLN